MRPVLLDCLAHYVSTLLALRARAPPALTTSVRPFNTALERCGLLRRLEGVGAFVTLAAPTAAIFALSGALAAPVAALTALTAAVTAITAIAAAAAPRSLAALARTRAASAARVAPFATRRRTGGGGHRRDARPSPAPVAVQRSRRRTGS